MMTGDEDMYIEERIEVEKKEESSHVVVLIHFVLFSILNSYINFLYKIRV